MEEDTTSKEKHFWKTKCNEIYQLCMQMKDENDYVTEKFQEMADLSVSLMQKVNELQD